MLIIILQIQTKGGCCTTPLERTEWDWYLAAGKLGLINSISKAWVDTGMKETPEEMIDFLMSFITKL